MKNYTKKLILLTGRNFALNKLFCNFFIPSYNKFTILSSHTTDFYLKSTFQVVYFPRVKRTRF